VRVQLKERIFFVEKETPKGYWIVEQHCAKRRWVSKYGRKRYAYPTKEEALRSLRRRKELHVEYARVNLETAYQGLNLIKYHPEVNKKGAE
jgi:hypothetical protein